jgi:hypothetical protein
MAGTGAELATRLDLPALRKVAAKARDVLVIDFFDIVGAKAANLPAGAETSATAAAATSAALRSIATGVTVGSSGTKAAASTAAAAKAATASTTKAGRAAFIAVWPRCRATAALLIFAVIAH